MSNGTEEKSQKTLKSKMKNMHARNKYIIGNTHRSDIGHKSTNRQQSGFFKKWFLWQKKTQYILGAAITP